MIKINTYTIKLNEYEIKKITNITESEEAKNIISKYAETVKTKATPKLPVAPVHRGKAEPLSTSLIVAPLKLKNQNINIKGNKYKTKGWYTQVKPRKKQTYYMVVMSGVNTYNGVKKNLNYSSANAEKFPIENAYRSVKKQMEAEFKNLITKKARGLDGK